MFKQLYGCFIPWYGQFKLKRRTYKPPNLVLSTDCQLLSQVTSNVGFACLIPTDKCIFMTEQPIQINMRNKMAKRLTL